MGNKIPLVTPHLWRLRIAAFSVGLWGVALVGGAWFAWFVPLTIVVATPICILVTVWALWGVRCPRCRVNLFLSQKTIRRRPALVTNMPWLYSVTTCPRCGFENQ